MSYDAITLRTLVEELKGEIVPGRVSQILQADSHTLIFGITARSKGVHLLVSTHPQFFRAHLVSQKHPSRHQLAPFTEQLREILRHAVITSVSQVNWDRVLAVKLSKKGSLLHSDLKLILELTGRMSNIIVTHTEDDLVLTCWRDVDATMCRYRHILPGQRYKPPPPPAGLDPQKADFGQFEAAMRRFQSEPLSKGLIKSVQALGHTLAAEAVYLAGVQFDTLISSLDTGQMKRLWEAVLSLIERVQEGRVNPTVYIGEGELPFAFSPLELKQFGPIPAKQFRSISGALEYYYASTVEKSEEERLRQHILAAIQKKGKYWKRTQERIGEELRKARGYDEYRRTGQLIVANMGVLKRGVDRADVVDYYHPDRPHITIELDPKLSPEENAKAYFRKAHKARNAISMAKNRLHQVDQQMGLLRRLTEEFEKAGDRGALLSLKERMVDAGVLPGEKPTVKRKTAKGTRFRRFVTSSGWTVLVGRNNRENDQLTFGVAAPEDVWFHARGAAGSHVVLRRQGRKAVPDKGTLQEAAGLAAYFSRARGARLVAVSFTERRYVRRPRGAKAGTVLMDREKSLMVEPKLLPRTPSAGEK